MAASKSRSRKPAAKKASKTRKSRAAPKKAAKARKQPAAGKKAAAARKSRPAAKKVQTSRKATRPAAVAQQKAAPATRTALSKGPTPDVAAAVADIDNRIGIVRGNLRELVQQAASYSGASDEERLSQRISEQEAKLEALRKQRRELAPEDE